MISDVSFQWIGQMPNPFAQDVVPAFDQVAGGDSVSMDLHAATLSRCQRVLAELADGDGTDVRPGLPARTIMIGAPRAGYGKTHLVGRLMSQAGSAASVVPMVFDISEEVNWQNLLRRVLRYFEVTAAAGSGAGTLWQETGRRLYAEVFLSAAKTADLGDDEPVVNPAELRRDFSTDLAPGGEDGEGSLRQWILENSHHLTELAGEDVCARWQIEPQALPLWMAAFRHSALEDVSSDERLAILRSLMPRTGEADAEIQAKNRLGELLRMASACRPLALVIDHLDGFYGNREVAMPLANTIAGLRGMVCRGLMLLCMNRDVWESVFEGALPSALTDRLNGEPAALGSISGQQARDLVENRLLLAGVDGVEAKHFVQQLADHEGWNDPESNGRYPRGVLRCASAMWERLAELCKAPEAAEQKPTGSESAVEPLQVTPPKPLAAAAQKPSDPPTEPGPVLPPMVAAPSASQVPAPAQVVQPTEQAAARFHPAPQSPTAAKESGGGGSMTDLQSIVSDIRSGGAWAVSEGPSPDELKIVAKAREAAVAPLAGASTAGGARVGGGGAMNGSEGAAPTTSGSQPATSAREVSPNEAELRQRVAAFRNQSAKGSLPWRPAKLERLIGEVGGRFAAVAQGFPQVGGQSCLQWTVRGRDVLMGFAPAEDSGFWKRLATRAASGAGGKLVAFVAGDDSQKQGFGSIADSAVDVINLKDDDLALLYAGDDMIAESSADNLEERVRFVARRMDPFWRRVTRAS